MQAAADALGLRLPVLTAQTAAFGIMVQQRADALAVIAHQEGRTIPAIGAYGK
jgi:hypothetical protein